MTLPYSPGITLGPKKYSGTGMTVLEYFLKKQFFLLKITPNHDIAASALIFSFESFGTTHKNKSIILFYGEIL
ncbi:MAG: hypothetical protein LBK62_13100 [Treponema sp.]|jgi:hypothetical protein|nr:hypothetical protein [Treponema sp.]